MSFFSSASSFNSSLAWSMGGGGRGRVPLQFPFDLGGWYNEQPCTQFQSLEHRKEPNGFQHEFIVLKLVDGSICRIERMGDPDARFDALSSRGSLAHDYAECFRPDELAKASLATSEVVAEVEFPCPLDILDVLMICRAIHEGEKTRNYTLQGFNCYFFSLAIQSCLTRLVARWEDMIPLEAWLLELKTAIEVSISNYRDLQIQQNEQPEQLLLRAYLVLNPDDPWSMNTLLRNVHYSTRMLMPTNPILQIALNGVLWYSDLSAELSRLGEEVVRLAWLQVLRAKFCTLPGPGQPVGPPPAATASSALPAHELGKLRTRCMAMLMKVVDSADDTKYITRRKNFQRLIRAPHVQHLLAEFLPFHTKTPPKLDYHGTEQPRLVEALTPVQWMSICWAHVQSMLLWALYVFFALLGVVPLDFGSKPRSCTIVDHELTVMISRLERLGHIGSKHLADYLQELGVLCDSHPAVWSELPWAPLCQAMKEYLSSDPPIPQEAIMLRVSFNGQGQTELMTVSEFQHHIRTRIESQARLIEQVRLGSAPQIKIELQRKLSQVWTLIRDDDLRQAMSIDPVQMGYLQQMQAQRMGFPGAQNMMQYPGFAMQMPGQPAWRLPAPGQIPVGVGGGQTMASLQQQYAAAMKQRRNAMQAPPNPPR